MSPWFKGGSNDLLADLLTQQGLQADDGGHRGSGSRRGLGVEELIRTSLSTWKPRGKSNKNYIQLLPAKTKSIKKAEKQKKKKKKNHVMTIKMCLPFPTKAENSLKCFSHKSLEKYSN